MSVARPASSTPDAHVRAAAIRLMAFDIDGVFTDGRIYYGPQGDALKAFNTLDGFGVKQIMRAGIDVAIITGRSSGIVATRAAELGITRVYQGAGDKAQVLAGLLADTGIGIDALGYMGDDWPDLKPLCRAHFACAPANAHPDVRARVHYVTQARGGEGAVREACDLILRARGVYDTLLASACGD
jgi:3-deoxy-D-manno-octulosonate 8-phosphate phosphatase (KDO 8-P phosphatase)